MEPDTLFWMAVVSTILFAIKACIGLMGLDHDFEFDSDGLFAYLSINTIQAATSAGLWVAYGLHGKPLLGVIVASIGVGMLAGLVVHLLLKGVRHLEEVRDVGLSEDLVGTEVLVWSSVSMANGQVVLVSGGARIIVSATTKDGKRLPLGSHAVIVEVSQNRSAVVVTAAENNNQEGAN